MGALSHHTLYPRGLLGFLPSPLLSHPWPLDPLILLPPGPSIVLPVGYMGQPTGLLHIYYLEEVMWLVSRGGYSDNLLKISAPVVFHQRFETKTLRYESQCSSTMVSWDLYINGGDIVFNAKGKANEIGQSWCPADLLDFQLPTTGTSQRPPIDPMQTPVSEIGSIKGKIHFSFI